MTLLESLLCHSVLTFKIKEDLFKLKNQNGYDLYVWYSGKWTFKDNVSEETLSKLLTAAEEIYVKLK